MKKIISALFCLFLLSCSKENLYEFHDLSGYRDFVYRIEFYPENDNEPLEFEINHLQTNGYDELREKGRFSTEKTTSYLTFEAAVKAYKLTGVDIYPVKNIKEIRVFFYETGMGVGPFPYTYNFTFYKSIENPEPISIRYDFETEEASFNLIGED